MRPVSLRLEGFGCYRKELSLSFEGLSLFAVSGATGAGKSTLIDAIVYALYGQVPRIGKQGVAEFMTLGTSRMSVLLQFEVEGATYRLLRKTRRAGKGKKAAQTDATLERLASGGAWKPVAGGASAVTERVEELLGLRADAFLRCVVLPQGELATFLASSAGDQRRILRTLLRLELFERMRQSAARERDRLDEELRQLQARLEEDFGEASPSRLAQLSAERARLELRAVQLEEEARTAEERRLALEERHRLGEERAARLRRRDAIDGERAAAGELRRRIDGHRRAIAILPLLEAHAGAARRAAVAEMDVAAAERACLAIRASAQDARRGLEDAEGAAREIEALDARLRTVAAVRGVAARRTKLRATLARDEGARQELLASEAWERSVADAARAARDDAAARAAESASSLERAGHDPEALALLEGGVAEALRAAALRTELGQLRSGIRETGEERARIDRLAGSGRARAEALATDLAARELALRQADDAVSDAERGEHVVALREKLHAGEPCPVCQQEVAKVPRTRVPANVGRARKAREAARHAREATLAEAARGEKELADLDARSELLAGEVRSLLEREATGARELQELEACLAARLGGAAGTEAPEATHARLLERARRAWRAHDAAREEITRREAERREQEHLAMLHHERAAAAAQRVAALDASIGEARAEVQELELAILEAAPDGDLDAEQARIEDRRRSLERGLDEARARAAGSQEDLARAEESLAARRETKERDELDERAVRERRDTALAAAGLPDEAAARAAVLPPLELDRMEVRLRDREDELRALLRRIAELDVELGDAPAVDPSELAEQRRRATGAAGERDATQRALAVAARDLEVLRERLALAETLRGRGAATRASRDLVATLAADLAGDAFQEHLLAGTIEALVRGASARLRDLSGRYALTIDDGAIAVVDHDHSGLVRPSETLSGGETFLAALALALELSALVQGAAGAHRLDSLFIDEGFGSLDAETLDTVTEAVEALAGTDRLVGIVTHVEELSRRMPASIAVSRATGEPVVTIVRA